MCCILEGKKNKDETASNTALSLPQSSRRNRTRTQITLMPGGGAEYFEDSPIDEGNKEGFMAFVPVLKMLC